MRPVPERGPVLRRERKRMHRSDGHAVPEKLFSPLDRGFEAVWKFLYGQHRTTTALLAGSLYLASMLALAPSIGVSGNYLVLVPLFAVASGFGLVAGAIAGLLALPLNLLLFAVLGHPEFSPESKVMAELSGIFVGTILGFVSDYFRKLEQERRHRFEAEASMKRSLQEKGILFRELHHRVRNNLNIIRSIVSLQARRSKDPAFSRAAEALGGRIMSVSFVFERLYRTAELAEIALDGYIDDLAGAICMGTPWTGAGPQPRVDVFADRVMIDLDMAVPLGLVINELLVNSLRHATVPGVLLSVRIGAKQTGSMLELEVVDNGPGYPSLPGSGKTDMKRMPELFRESLGMTLVALMLEQLNGDGFVVRENGFTRCSLTFPVSARSTLPEPGRV